MENFISQSTYQGMSSFQLGKDNKQGRNASVLEDGIATVCSKFDGVYYLNHECDCCIYGKTFIVVQ